MKLLLSKNFTRKCTQFNLFNNQLSPALVYKIPPKGYKSLTKRNINKGTRWKSYFRNIYHNKISTILFYLEQIKLGTLRRVITFRTSSLGRQNAIKRSIHVPKKKGIYHQTKNVVFNIVQHKIDSILIRLNYSYQ